MTRPNFIRLYTIPESNEFQLKKTLLTGSEFTDVARYNLLVEYLLLNQQKINVTPLVKHYGTSRQTISKIVRRWRTEAELMTKSRHKKQKTVVSDEAEQEEPEEEEDEEDEQEEQDEEEEEEEEEEESEEEEDSDAS